MLRNVTEVRLLFVPPILNHPTILTNRHALHKNYELFSVRRHGLGCDTLLSLARSWRGTLLERGKQR